MEDISRENTLVEAISQIGKLGQTLNSDELRDSMKQMGNLLVPKTRAPEQPKDPRKRLCPVVCCCKCGAHTKTLYSYVDRKICKECRRKEENK